MCGRAGAHTGARDGRADGVRPVGCSTSEQSASRASAPAHTRHTRRTGPTRTTRHTAPSRARVPGRRQRGHGRSDPAHVAQCATRTHGAHTAHGRRRADQRSKERDARDDAHTGNAAPARAPLRYAREYAITPATTRVRARHATHTAHTAHGTHGARDGRPGGQLARRAAQRCSESEQSASRARGPKRRRTRAPLRYARGYAGESASRARPYDMRACTPPLRYARGCGYPPVPWAPPRRHAGTACPVNRNRSPVSGVQNLNSGPTRRDRRAPGVDTDANPLGVSP